MDIKNLKEVLAAVNLLSCFVIKQVKDGIDLSDATALVSFLMAEENQKMLKDAIDSIGQVPAEVKDLSLAEGMELATFVIASIPQFVNALKK